MLQCSLKIFYGCRCPTFHIYWNNTVWHCYFGNEINLQLFFSPFTIQATTGFFNIIDVLDFFAPRRSTIGYFFYSFDLVFVLNVLLEKVQVSHNKNNGHSKKHCFDDKTYIYGGAYHVLVIETVCVFQKCSFRRR